MPEAADWVAAFNANSNVADFQREVAEAAVTQDRNGVLYTFSDGSRFEWFTNPSGLRCRVVGGPP